MEKAKIIISGGDGFIGSNIINQFHKKYDFIVLKRRGSSIHYAEIGELATIQVEPEIGNKVILEFSDAVGMILLGASRPNPASPGLIKDVFDMDINHTKRMLDLCVFNNIQQVVFASSKSVYGLNDSQPFSEDIEPLSETLYGLNKLLTEKLGLYYERNRNIKFTALRLAQVFGIGDNYPNMINKFMKNALTNRDLEVWSDGNSDCRTYIYINDVADAFIHFIETGIAGVFNIGMDKTFSPKQIAEYIVKHKLTNSQVVYKSEKYIIPRNEQFSIIKTKKEASWESSWEIEQALNDFRDKQITLEDK